MVLDEPRGRASAVQAPSRTPARVVWHDLECGGYRADLALWRELAAHPDGPILDVGAGSGRVSLDLLAAGHAVTALDLDPLLLAALSERAATRGLEVESVCADARTFALARRDFALCVAPMQTIQLLGGVEGRVAFLDRAREHLRPGARIACAILCAVEPFDCSDGTVGPAAERAHVDGLLYLSRAIRVSELAESIVIERERRVLADPPSAADGPSQAASEVAPPPERDVIELDRISADDLERDARRSGLRPLARHEIPATDEHVGSVVVVLGV
ncbi:MAG TPA: methyltransferase domain-containing protein [Solirubrobacteraceae bacterium]|nr:methyltransferase domain-containing protein [Solirubrobacteraceae bacterium]